MVGAPAHGFKIDVRILAACDRPLGYCVEDGDFSAALYEKLAATRIVMPPLRERAGDIPGLTRYFLAKIGEIEGMTHHSIADSGLSLLEARGPRGLNGLRVAPYYGCQIVRPYANSGLALSSSAGSVPRVAYCSAVPRKM